MKLFVIPTSENVLKFIKHPDGTSLKSMTEPTQWPADQFTFRRIADGDVKEYVAEPEAPKAIVAEPEAPKSKK
jgi:hypothetical protein